MGKSCLPDGSRLPDLLEQQGLIPLGGSRARRNFAPAVLVQDAGAGGRSLGGSYDCRGRSVEEFDRGQTPHWG